MRQRLAVPSWQLLQQACILTSAVQSRQWCTYREWCSRTLNDTQSMHGKVVALVLVR
jgi:hypothetical protein